MDSNKTLIQDLKDVFPVLLEPLEMAKNCKEIKIKSNGNTYFKLRNIK